VTLEVAINLGSKTSPLASYKIVLCFSLALLLVLPFSTSDVCCSSLSQGPECGQRLMRVAPEYTDYWQNCQNLVPNEIQRWLEYLSPLLNLSEKSL
jgi:hypothetical protein